MEPLIKIIEEALENSRENGYEPNEMTPEELTIDLLDVANLGENFTEDEVLEAVNTIRVRESLMRERIESARTAAWGEIEILL